MKRTIRLNESDLVRIVEGTARRMLTELDWKTYANAAKKSAERAFVVPKDDYIENERKRHKENPDENKGRFSRKKADEKYEKMRTRENARRKKFDRAAGDAFNRDHLHGKYDPFEMQYYNNTFDDDLPAGEDKINGLSTMIVPSADTYYINQVGRSRYNPKYHSGADKYGNWIGEYLWDPYDGLRVDPDLRYSTLSDIPSEDMRKRYEGTPIYDMFNRIKDEIDVYTGVRNPYRKYRYDKGEGWNRYHTHDGNRWYKEDR